MLQTNSSVDNMAVDIMWGDKVIGVNKPLNGIVEQNNIIETFENYLTQKDSILLQEEGIVKCSSINYFRDFHNACKGVLSSSYRVIESPYLIKPFIFKYKTSKKGIEPLSNYKREGYHLRNSLARTVMGDESVDISLRAKRVVYILYDFEFHNADDIDTVSFLVRSDIVRVISYIINKAETKSFNQLDTYSMVEALRIRLNIEEAQANAR